MDKNEIVIFYLFIFYFCSSLQGFSFQNDYCIWVILMVSNNDGNCLGNYIGILVLLFHMLRCLIE